MSSLSDPFNCIKIKKSADSLRSPGTIKEPQEGWHVLLNVSD